MRYRYPVFNLILSMQCIAAFYAFSMDLVLPFSNAQAVAHYIQANQLSQTLLIGDRDWATLTVSGYLDRPMYYPSSKTFGTFITWNGVRRDNINITDLFAAVDEMIKIQRSDGLLILNYPLPTAIPSIHQVSPLAQFTGAIVRDENYYLYRITRSPAYYLLRKSRG
jgi:hypothetical protein